MIIKSKPFILGLAVAAFSTMTASAAMAQDARPATAPRTVPELLNEAFFANDRDFYQNQSISRQVSYIFGPGILIRNSFPDSEIARDGKAIDEVYRDVLARQTATQPIRTVDLVQPFNLSIRELPTAADVQSSGGVVIAPPVEAAPAPLPPQTKTPVPALW